jgi:sec-independent protein translocase protein TatC
MIPLKKGKSEDEKRKFSGNPEDFRLSLVEHLEELRTRILRSVAVLIVAWVGGWFAFPSAYAYLNSMVDTAIKQVVPDDRYGEKFDNLMGPFMLQLQLSFFIGLVIAFPFIVLQLWGFVAPALKEQERKPIRRLVPLSVLLFALGVGFCWMVLPSALQWFAGYLLNFQGAMLLQTAGTMVFFILKMLFAFGVAFQLPLFVYILGILDLLKAETLLKYWRHSATGIFVISMVITPSQDPMTMLLMAVPLTILFLMSVYAVKFTQRRRKRAAEAAEEATTYLLPAAQAAPDLHSERSDEEEGERG